MKTVEVSESALESLKAMVDQLQDERDELLVALQKMVNWYGMRNIESDELRPAYLQPHDVANAMNVIAKCTAKPEVLE